MVNEEAEVQPDEQTDMPSAPTTPQPQPASSLQPVVTDPYAQALDAIGLGRFSLRIFLLAGLGWISDGAEAAVLSYMLPALKQQHGLEEADLGAISSLLSGSQALGAMFWGYTADVAGRRPAFLASVGLTALLGMASALSGSSLSVYVALRAATGFAIGGNLPLAVTVTSELLPPRYRDRALVGLHLFYEAGALTSTGLALALMPDSCKPDTRCEWPLYLALVAAPAACVALCAVFFLPESPIWLGSQGRHTEARAVLALAMCSGRTAGATPLEPPVRPPADGAAEEPRAGARAVAGGRSWVPRALAEVVQTLFGRRLLPTTLLVCALWLSADAASGWWTWLPELASRQGVPALNMYISSIVGRIVASGAFLVATALIGCMRARALLLVCLASCTALSAVLSVWANSPALFASPSFVPLYGTFALFFGGLWSLMYPVTPPFFPAHVRGSGFGLASASGKLGQVSSPLIASRLADTSVLAMGGFFTVLWACATGFLLLLTLLDRSTRRSATLVQVQGADTRCGEETRG